MIQLSIGNQAIESTLLIETYFGAGVFCASRLRVKRGAERKKSLRAYGYWKLNGAEKHFVKAKWLWTGSFIVSGVWRRIVQKRLWPSDSRFASGLVDESEKSANLCCEGNFLDLVHSISAV